MARMTAEGDALVVRLVYDGPPRSGKTTSVGSLAHGMGRSHFTAGEMDGRTLYFDWLEYVGGSFEGIPIRCQILSVPGQAELTARRWALLSEADAIVFVLNGVPEHLPESAAHLRGLRAFLDSQPVPHPGIVVQANHRDRADALPLAQLQEALGSEGLALVESVATENQGIRKAFVLAVRLALDRVRELIREGNLQAGPGETDAPEALLAWLRSLEGESSPEPVRTAPPAGTPGVPRLPDSSAPTGRVWPPVDGRMILHSATAQAAVPSLARDGSWRCQAASWHFHSAPRHEFERLDDAKQELLSWAQRHAANFHRLSSQRCIALAETGWGRWRLWQIVQGRQSLRKKLRAALQAPVFKEREELLRTCVALLLEARQSFQTGPPLPWGLDLIGESGGRPVYIGILPPLDWEPENNGHLQSPDADAVRREIQPLIEQARRETPSSGPDLLASLEDALTSTLVGS